MTKPLRSSILYFCLASIAIVLVWAGFLVFQWYRAHELEKLIIPYVTMEKPPYAGVPKSQWIAESKAFEERRTEVFGRLDKLADWQRNMVLANALDAWKACNPRHSYGSRHLWTLLEKNAAQDLIGRMIETPLISYRVANPNAKTLAEAIRWLHEEYWLPLSFLSVDRPLIGGDLAPSPDHGLRSELTALATINGLVWEVSDQTILLGTQEELDDYRRQSENRRRRIAAVGFASPAANQTVQEKLDGLVTLDYYGTQLRGASDFLIDYLGVNIVLLSGPTGSGQASSQFKADSPINVLVQNVPASVGFDCVVKQLGLKWDVLDEVVAIGTPQELDDFEKRIQRRFKRMDSLPRSTNPQEQLIRNSLANPVTLEFVETPLRYVIDFLKDYGGFNGFALNSRSQERDAAEPLADKPVTVHVQGVTLGMALDCLAEQNGFDWDVVDGFLCMGQATGIEQFRVRLSESDRKLARADEALVKFLQSPLVTVSPGREKVKTDPGGSVYGSVSAKRIEPAVYSPTSIVEFFVATELIHGPPSEFGDAIACFSRNDIPFYRALDVVCELTGMDWEVRTPETIRLVQVGN